MTELKKMRIQFEANLKALAQAHLALLEQGEKYMPQLHLPNMTMAENQR
jgi:cell division initiation protein